MDIVAAYEQVGTYRGAAALCGTTHKTVKRVIERRRAGEPFDAPRRQLPKNTDAVANVIAEKVRATDGRISAKRLLPVARTAGYEGSARNFRVPWPRPRGRGGGSAEFIGPGSPRRASTW